jgi:hypothetical protein
MFRPPGPAGGSSSPFYKSKGRESLHREIAGTVLLLPSCGPNGPVDDDGGASIPCPGATCAVWP